MRKLVSGAALAGAALLAGLAFTLTTSNPARANADGTYFFDLHCGAICIQVGSPPDFFGNVQISGDGTHTLSYAFNIDGGALFHGQGGLTTAFMDFSGAIQAGGIAITDTTFTWTRDTTNPGNPVNPNGLNPFGNVGFNCTGVGSGNPCGTTVTFTFTGVAGDTGLFTVNNTVKGGFSIFAGADLTCSTAAGATCASSPFSEFTGVLGATSSHAVPGPVAGAGIPGLIFACSTLIGLARRRRQIA